MAPVFARLCAALRRFSLGKKSFTVAALGYIGPADAAPGGHLPLSPGRPVIQTVAQGDDGPLPLVQALPHTPAHLGTGVPGIQVLQHVVVHRDHIHQGQGISIPTVFHGVGQGHLPL